EARAPLALREAQLRAEREDGRGVHVRVDLVADREERLDGAGRLEVGCQQQTLAVEVARARPHEERSGARGLRVRPEEEVEVKLLARLEGQVGRRRAGRRAGRARGGRGRGGGGRAFGRKLSRRQLNY